MYDLTKDYQLTSLISTFLQNRRFQVSLQGKRSRWRIQKNGLPQGSVLAPALYNIYTNDQPIPVSTRLFIYADDTAVAAQGSSLEEVEGKLTSAMDVLSKYYDANHLKPNPSKTQVCAFHLRNREAQRQLDIIWRGERLKHCPTPVYLGVTLDRALTYRQQCLNTKQKVIACNGIIKKLTSSTWGASPHILRTSALALCVSAAEYAAPVWYTSVHAKQVDTAVNDTARIISGCMKPTPVQKLYPIVGIAPPNIRRATAADIKRTKQENDHRHPLFGHQAARSRLRSRKSFLASTSPLDGTPETTRLNKWRTLLPSDMSPKEELAPGADLPYPVWRSLNRLRVGVPRCKTNLKKWGILPANADTSCECGAEQDPSHLLTCPLLDNPCTTQDVTRGSDKAIAAAVFWKC